MVNSIAWVRLGLLALCGFMIGCPGTTERRAGQIEAFRIDEYGQLCPTLTPHQLPDKLPYRHTVKGDFGEAIRFNEDVVTIQVLSAYLERLPPSFLGSTDIILFAEVWENAALGYRSPSLNTIVYIAENQRVPGRLNFKGNLAYGPTTYKGHPLKLKFTLMLLQRRKGEQASSAASVVNNFVSATAAASPYGAVASQAVAVIREILRSQPDVIAFDYEQTFFSDEPEGLKPTILDQSQQMKVESATKTIETTSTLLAKGGSENLMQAAEILANQTAGLLNESEKRLLTVAQADLSQKELLFEVARLAASTSDASTTIRATQKYPYTANRGIGEWTASSDDSQIDRMPPVVRDSEQLERSRAAQDQSEEALRRTLTSAITAARIQREKWEQEIVEAWRRYIEAHPAASTSPWNATLCWLGYHTYAIIETEHFVPAMGESPARRHLFPLGWEGEYHYLAGYLAHRRPEAPSADYDRLHCNYLVFSITPRQIAQEDAVLRAASTATDKLMNDLRQSENAAANVSSAADALAQNLKQEVLSAKVDELARSAAAAAQDANDPQSDFDKRFTDLFEALKSRAKYDDVKFWNQLRTEADLKWKNRLDRLKPKAQVENPPPPNPD